MSIEKMTHIGVLTIPSKNCINFPMKNKYPNNIKTIRENRGLSQDALAKKIGTIKGQIYKLESGERKLTHPWMVRIASALNCNIAELVETKLPDNHLSDGELALVDAIKDIIQVISLNNPHVPNMLRNAFSYQRAEYEDRNLKNAVLVMELLGKFVGEPSPGKEQTLIRRLLQIAPVGSA